MFFFSFWALLLKINHFCVCDIFYLLSGYPIKSIFQCQDIFIRRFWWSSFPLNYQNAYGHQTFQGGDMERGKKLSPVNTHDISIEWSCSVMWQIKYISQPAEDVSTPQYASCWHSVKDSQTWPFNQVTKMRSRDSLKNLYLHIHEVYS